MISIRRSNAQDADFKKLVSLLDAELAALDGDQAAFYAGLNKTADNIDVVVAYIDGQPVSSGAIRPYTKEQIEVKRMFTLKEHRGKGIAAEIVRELETWARELGYKELILETGKRQPWAIALYKRVGFVSIPNYGHYASDDNSVCFKKSLS